MTLKTFIAPAVAALALAAGTLVVVQTSNASDASLRGRLLQPAELPNFATVLCPGVVKDSYRWAGRYTSAASLQQNGFEAGLSEPLYSMALRAQGVASVARFGSEHGARAEAARELAAARQSPGRFSSYRVAGMPGAFGFMIDRGTVVERDVVFAAGRYVYLVGVTYRTGTSTAVPASWLTGAAVELSERS
jgi:hypothetical protein